MTVACSAHSRVLRNQLRQPTFALLSTSSPSGSRPSSDSESPVGQDNEKKELRTLFRTVIATSIALCLSMFAYFSVCLVGNLAVEVIT